MSILDALSDLREAQIAVGSGSVSAMMAAGIGRDDARRVVGMVVFDSDLERADYYAHHDAYFDSHPDWDLPPGLTWGDVLEHWNQLSDREQLSYGGDWTDFARMLRGGQSSPGVLDYALGAATGFLGKLFESETWEGEFWEVVGDFLYGAAWGVAITWMAGAVGTWLGEWAGLGSIGSAAVGLGANIGMTASIAAYVPEESPAFQAGIAVGSLAWTAREVYVAVQHIPGVPEMARGLPVSGPLSLLPPYQVYNILADPGALWPPAGQPTAWSGGLGW